MRDQGGRVLGCGLTGVESVVKSGKNSAGDSWFVRKIYNDLFYWGNISNDPKHVYKTNINHKSKVNKYSKHS